MAPEEKDDPSQKFYMDISAIVVIKWGFQVPVVCNWFSTDSNYSNLLQKPSSQSIIGRIVKYLWSGSEGI